ncbi:MAG: hypothetical protein WCJ26_13645 [bacterium]
MQKDRHSFRSMVELNKVKAEHWTRNEIERAKFCPFSDWASFHELMAGIKVFDRYTGKEVAKFALWGKFKKKQKDLELLGDRMHPDYRFDVNADYEQFLIDYKEGKA